MRAVNFSWVANKVSLERSNIVGFFALEQKVACSRYKQSFNLAKCITRLHFTLLQVYIPKTEIPVLLFRPSI